MRNHCIFRLFCLKMLRQGKTMRGLDFKKIFSTTKSMFNKDIRKEESEKNNTHQYTQNNVQNIINNDNDPDIEIDNTIDYLPDYKQESFREQFAISENTKCNITIVAVTIVAIILITFAYYFMNPYYTPDILKQTISDEKQDKYIKEYIKELQK